MSYLSALAECLACLYFDYYSLTCYHVDITQSIVLPISNVCRVTRVLEMCRVFLTIGTYVPISHNMLMVTFKCIKNRIIFLLK